MNISIATMSIARGAAATAIVALLVFGMPSDRSPELGRVVTSATPVETVASEVASHRTGPIVYSDSVPPTRAVAGLLGAGAALERRVSIRVPAEPAAVEVRAPRAPRAQRRAALSVTLRSEPNRRVRLSIRDGAGRVDTVTVDVGDLGITTRRIAIEPARGGLERWTVDATLGGVSLGHANASAWVRPAKPVRAMVLTGPPDWETRFLIRALEANGVDVDVRQVLGPQLVVASEGLGGMPSLGDLDGVDVVVTASIDAAFATELEAWIGSTGNGLLSLGAGRGSSVALSAADLTWSGPAEIVPLPALPVDVTGRALSAVAGEGAVVTGTGVTDAVASATYVSAGMVGRGRLIRSGVETWPWVLEGGAEDAHGTFWMSVVEWLADGLTEDVLVTGRAIQPHAMWEGRLEGEIPDSITVTWNGGSDIRPAKRLSNGRGRVRFVPTTPGAHTLRVNEGGDPAVVLVRSPEESSSWAQAALEVGAGGGTIVSASTRDPTADAPIGSEHDRTLLFLALAGLMGAGWAVRRLNGLA